eukprot:7823326-Lingulodinium_polyedra.AAC.1
MPPGPITVVGDNLGVVRYCAATAGSQNTELHNILDDPLTTAACTGRRLHWMAVRRHYNKAADALATAGCSRAARLAASGGREP